MNSQRGYGEADIGSDARPVSRGGMVTLSRGELADLVLRAKRKANRAFAYAGIIGAVTGLALGFGATSAFGAETLSALYIGLTPTGGATVTVYGGVLTTPELCQMAGDGIAVSIEASVAGIDVTFACIPLPGGEDA